MIPTDVAPLLSQTSDSASAPQPVQPAPALAVAPSAPVAPQAPQGLGAQVPSSWPTSQITAQQIARAMDNYPVQPGKPGSFAASVVAGFQGALANVAAPKQVPPGGGFLEGIAAATNAFRQNQLQGQEMAMRQAQLAQENQRENRRLSLDEQKAAVAIASAHTEQIMHAKISRNADLEFQQRIIDQDQKEVDRRIQSGSNVVAQDLSSDDISRQLANRQLSANGSRPFQTGLVPVVGSDGKQVVDSEGNPVLRPTFTILSPIPNNGNIKLTADQAKFLRDNGQGNIQEGQEMPDAYHQLLLSRAKTQLAVTNNVEEVQARIARDQSEKQRADAQTREANLTIQERQQNDRAKQIFAPYLAAANGDAVIGLQYMAADPKQAGNLGLVQQLYGPGSLEKVRTDTLKSIDATIAEDTRTLTEHSKYSSEPLSAQDEQDLRNEVTAAQAKKNQYLGLHPTDPPAFAEAKKMLDAIPPQQRAAQIATIQNPAARAYLYRVYNIPVPQAAPVR